ncbi:MAG: hypothetical protein Q9198_000228 [Flavoplaca austrocitrina]
MGPIQGVVGVAADLFILSLPIPVVHNLKLASGKKLGLLVVFLMGAFAVIASSVSLYYRFDLYTGTDKFWDGPSINACVFAEGYTTIIVSCAPAMSSFWMNIFTKSAIYSRLRSGSFFSWHTRGATTEATSLPRAQKQAGSSMNQEKASSGYHELQEVAYGKSYDEVSRSTKVPLGSANDGIRKSTTIVQISRKSPP